MARRGTTGRTRLDRGRRAGGAAAGIWAGPAEVPPGPSGQATLTAVQQSVGRRWVFVAMPSGRIEWQKRELTCGADYLRLNVNVKKEKLLLMPLPSRHSPLPTPALPFLFFFFLFLCSTLVSDDEKAKYNRLFVIGERSFSATKSVRQGFDSRLFGTTVKHINNKPRNSPSRNKIAIAINYQKHSCHPCLQSTVHNSPESTRRKEGGFRLGISNVCVHCWQFWRNSCL